MQLSELSFVPFWARRNIEPLQLALGELHSALHVNATQNNKVPVEPSLKSAMDSARSVRLEQLSEEQIQMLDSLEVLYALGPKGAQLINEVVQKAGYDPATAASEISQMASRMSSAFSRLMQLDASLESFGYQWNSTSFDSDQVIIRLHFSGEAGIHSIPELKSWSSDWFDIARGVSGCVHETPDDVRVIGASTGSVILVLTTSAAAAAVLALMSKHVATIVKNVYEIRNTQEDFRHKKFMNKALEDALQASLDEQRNGAEAVVLGSIRELLKEDIPEELVARLRLAIKRFFDFTEKGGGMEILPPASRKETDPDISDSIRELNSIIEETRRIRTEMEQLKIERKP